MRPGMIARQKVTTACEACRQRKIKCNGRSPVCTPCSLRDGAQCVYRIRRPPNSQSRRLLPLISNAHSNPVGDVPEDRTTPIPGPQKPITSIAGAPSSAPGLDEAFESPAQVSPRKEPSSNQHEVAGYSREPTNEGSVNVNITEHSPQKSSPGTEVFGHSSADSFMRQVSSAIDARLGWSPETVPVTHEVYPSSHTRAECPTTIGRSPLDYPLPQRRNADDLLKAYYDLVWAVLPIHDRTVFQQCYDAIWLGGTMSMPENIFYCMMNVALALGSQFSETVRPHDRKHIGQTFWKHASRLFEAEIKNNASTEAVQCLLMMGLYLQSTCESYQCWMSVGSAIRMAQSLGLHLASAGRHISRQAQVARRVWHGCIYMDRMLSMIFGRPSMIPVWLSDTTPLPCMIDDEFLDSQQQPAAIRPDGNYTIVAFFVKSLELYEIVNGVLLNLYMSTETDRHKGDHSVASVLRFDDRLVSWSASLPQHLRYSLAGLSEDPVFRRQQIVLRARFLHARILLFRPILAESYLKQNINGDDSHSEERSLSQGVTTECARILFASAHEIVNVIYTHFDFETVTGPVPAWWYAVLFVYTAAVVLLAERLRPVDTTQSLSPLPGNDAFDKALQLLKAWAKVGDSAKRCIAALETLSEKIDVSSNHLPPQTWEKENQQPTGESSNVDYADFHLEIDDMLWSINSTVDTFQWESGMFEMHK
ncbi:C6 transcription factor [Xylaria arbuscula]|nr:C6 transcription factor [Xylaria arbuscula]